MATRTITAEETASSSSALLTGGTGYGWVYTHALSGTYAPVSGYAYNSNFGAMQVQSLGTGSYLVRLNGLNGGRA